MIEKTIQREEKRRGEKSRVEEQGGDYDNGMLGDEVETDEKDDVDVEVEDLILMNDYDDKEEEVQKVVVKAKVRLCINC